MSIHKLSILISVLILQLPQLFSQEEALRVNSVIYKGVDFIEADDWGEVLALAELEDKIIFLDAYTPWCRPCKKMDEDVFSRPDVGELYNGNFLNVKMNMEEGEGIRMAEQYRIIAYPSLFFLYPDGSVLHRATGYKGPSSILKLGRQSKMNENTTASFEERYEEGEKTPDFLYEYLQSSIEAKDGQQTNRLKEYLDTRENWNTDEIRTLLFTHLDTPDSPLFDHLLESKSAYVEQFGASKVENKIQALVYSAIRKAEDPLTTAPLLFKKAYPEKADQLIQQFSLNHYRDVEDGVNYSKEALAFVKSTSPITEEGLNEIAWNFYDLVDDPVIIKILLKKIKIRKKTANTYLNNESLALLFAKTGKIKKAKKLAQKAIKLAKTNKISTASAEDFLAELERR